MIGCASKSVSLRAGCVAYGVGDRLSVGEGRRDRRTVVTGLRANHPLLLGHPTVRPEYGLHPPAPADTPTRSNLVSFLAQVRC